MWSRKLHWKLINILKIMKSKSLLIAIAAFAVTTTGVSAYTGVNLLAQAGLSGQQIEAVQTAGALSKNGYLAAARVVLLDAGIDEETLGAINEVKSDQDQGRFKIVDEESVTAGQQNALHVARQANDRKTVMAILEEVGEGRGGHGWHKA